MDILSLSLTATPGSATSIELSDGTRATLGTLPVSSAQADADAVVLAAAAADATSKANAAQAAAIAASQPLDSDLTSYANAADAAARRALISAETAGAAATAQAAAIAASQPLDSDLTAIAALTTTSFGRSFLPLADASAGRTLLGLGTLATQSGTFSGTSSGTNTGDQTALTVANTPAGGIAATTVQAALNELDTEKAPLASPTFTGTVSGITKSMISLGNVDNTSDANKPVSTAQQTALDLKLSKTGEGVNFVTADASPDNAVTNGTNLLAAYDSAKLLAPNGAALSATNRAVVFVPPGIYDLVTTALTMDTQFVDLVGVSGNPEHVLITSVVAVNNTGTLVQTVNDVLISGVTLENTQNSNSRNNNATDPAAYAPSSNKTLAKLRDVVMRGSSFGWSMRRAITYSGTFTNCTGGDYSFGSNGGGLASGTFTNCTGGNYAFGGDEGTASGTLTNCTGGDSAFGGYYGTASGTLTNCTGGDYSFGGYGTASGTFKDCTGGTLAFGGDGTASGTFTNCTGGILAFGGFGGSASGKLYTCRLTAGTFQTVQARAFTVTIATPGVFTLTAHNFIADTKIRFTTTGALPTGLAVATTYFVIATGLTANNYQVSATLGGAAINTTGTQSGVHTARSGRTINCIDGFDNLNNQ